MRAPLCDQRSAAYAQVQKSLNTRGGTGLSTLLRGLKEYTGNLTAIVTVADDGGSSGRLRRELGVLPPGDFRQCLVALSDVEPLLDEDPPEEPDPELPLLPLSYEPVSGWGVVSVARGLGRQAPPYQP